MKSAFEHIQKAIPQEPGKPAPGERKSDAQLERLQRRAYMQSKGLKPSDQFQLDLVFPDTIGDRDDLRHIPNDYARSSLFTARNKREPRKRTHPRSILHWKDCVLSTASTESIGCSVSRGRRRQPGGGARCI